MRFAEPHWLIIGALVFALLFVLRVRGERLTARALDLLSGARLVDSGALPSRFRRWLRVFVSCFAVALGFVALARPQQGKEWQTLDRKGTDLLLVLDTSKSMNSDDVSPTRLERTKLAVRDLVDRAPEDRIGLVGFAGDAYLESPLTLDHGALLETLDAFDSSLIGHPGTDIGRAIDAGALALKADPGNQKLMVLLTDGEDLAGGALEAAKRAGNAGIRIDTVGVGTPAGELVPLKNERGATVGVLRDENGNPVRSRLDEPGLRAIAQAAHGTYRSLGADGGGLDRLYAESLAPLAHLEQGARVQRVYREWFALPLALSLLALAGDALLGLGWRMRRRSQRRARGAGLGQAAAAATAACVLLLPAAAHASVQSAERAYKAGKFADSAREYAAEQSAHPKDPRLAVDAGDAAYRAGRFDAAEAALEHALTLADPKLQERVLYDLGDARYRLGAATLKDGPEKTIERWKAAIASYDGALKLSPNDADAKFNRDFVKRKLAELENQQKQKPQQNQQNQSGKKNDEQNQSDKKNGGANQEQQGKKSGRERGQSAGSSAGGEPQKPGEHGKNDERAGHDQKGNDHADANGEPRNPGARTANGPRANSDRGEGAAPKTLSARDARALLGSLRGEERHVRFGESAPPERDDVPRKDW
ncbi:MAG TPA: VWA domain-containing protein [Polyangiaceae bacterium]|jgi:Ca-activated chloride channel family protein